jgi:hypothetical protein
VVSLGLAFDARYRDFPILAFAIPAAAHLVLWLSGRDRPVPMPSGEHREEALLALILIGASLAIPVIEGPQNIRALAWCAEGVLLGLPWLRYAPSALRMRGDRSAQVAA